MVRAFVPLASQIYNLRVFTGMSAATLEIEMSGDIYEQAVETFLTMKREVFVHPQYYIGDNQWGAEPDFLAIDFPERAIWMVEVTRAQAKLSSKINEFGREYEGRIREQLIADQVIPKDNASKWNVGFWAFVPKWDCQRVKTLLEKAGVRHQVTPLDDALSLEAWEKRFAKPNEHTPG